MQQKFTFSAPAAQLIAAEISQAHEQSTPFFVLKAMAASLSLYPLVYPAGRKKKGQRTPFILKALAAVLYP